jgi:hypothetical protein
MCFQVSPKLPDTEVARFIDLGVIVGIDEDPDGRFRKIY